MEQVRPVLYDGPVKLKGWNCTRYSTKSRVRIWPRVSLDGTRMAIGYVGWFIEAQRPQRDRVVVRARRAGARSPWCR